jgi:hypothetical protein
MKKIIPFIALFFAVFIVGCDKVEGPYTEVSTGNNGDRKILIEDFTGHLCPNCPRAAETIKTLQQLRPGRVIAIGEHVTSIFAAPGSGIYNIDFRTAIGNSNDSLFHVSDLGLPSGMVNRISLNGTRRIEYAKWSEYADSLLNLPAEALITIENTYTATNRIVITTVKCDFLKDLNNTYKLAVYLIEDSILHAQKDNQIPSPANDSDYVHSHVLRGAFNGAFGEVLNAAAISVGNNFSKTYARALGASWKEKKCAVVAFIYDASTKEILQAEEKEVIY